MIRQTLSILIPAAGSSSRLGQAKQLVKFNGIPLIQNVINIANSLAPLEIIVVTGANAEVVTAAVQSSEPRWIHNRHWSDGIGGSIALGTTSISPAATGLMILLCDQWLIQTSDLQQLASKWRSDPGCIVASEVNGKHMPPVIFPSVCFEGLRKLTGDQGARKILESHSELLTPVSLKNAAFDLNTQSQLEALEKFQGI